jgi:hypothetical protein
MQVRQSTTLRSVPKTVIGGIGFCLFETWLNPKPWQRQI